MVVDYFKICTRAKMHAVLSIKNRLTDRHLAAEAVDRVRREMRV